MNRYWIGLFVLFSISAQAQQVLSLPDLVQRAKDSSFMLKQNDLLRQRANLRNTEGFAGNLPELIMSGNGQYDLNNTRLEFFDGETRTANNASNIRAGLNLDLTYNLIEGGAKDARKRNLELDLEQSMVGQSIEEQDIVLEIIQSYLDYKLALRQKEIYEVDSAYWSQIIGLNKQIQAAGRSNKLELLQLQAQKNSSLINLKNADRDLTNSRTVLEELCFISTEDSVTVAADIREQINPIRSSASEITFPSLQSILIDIERSRNAESLAKSAQWPVLQLFAGFGYNWSRNAVGILLSNQNFGPYGGLRLNWNIYSGYQTQKNIQSAVIDQEVARKNFELQSRSIEYSLKNAKRLQKEEERIILKAEQQIQLIEDQLNLIDDQFKAGAINLLDVLDFQRQRTNALLTKAAAEYRLEWQIVSQRYWEGRFSAP